MIYCDTSLLIAVLTDEARSDEARRWYLRHGRQVGAFSNWTIAEVFSALALKHRMGVIGDVHRRAIEQAWAAIESEMTFIPVTAAHFARVPRLVDSQPRGLRAGDALHLAIVLDRGCALATFDRDLADAGSALGVAVHPG